MKTSIHIPVASRNRGIAGMWTAMITSSWFILVGHLGEVGYPMFGADVAYAGYLVWRHNFHNGEPLVIGKTPKPVEPARKPAMWPPVDTHCYVCGMEDVGGKRMEVFKTADHPSCVEWLGEWNPPLPDFGPETVRNAVVVLPKRLDGTAQWRIYSRHSALTGHMVDGVMVNERKAEVMMPGDTPAEVIMNTYGGGIGYGYAQRGTEVIRLDGDPSWLSPKPGGPHKGIVEAGEWHPVKDCSCRECQHAAFRDQSGNLRRSLDAAVSKLEANDRRIADMTEQLHQSLLRAFRPPTSKPAAFTPSAGGQIAPGHMPHDKTRDWSPVEGCTCLPCKYATNWRNR